MLDLNFVRNNLDLVQRKVEAKGTPFDRKLFTELDRKRREQITNIENIKNKKNTLGKEIGMLKRQNADTKDLEEQSKVYSTQITTLEEELEKVEQQFQDFILNVPNLFDD